MSLGDDAALVHLGSYLLLVGKWPLLQLRVLRSQARNEPVSEGAKDSCLIQAVNE